MLIQRTMGGNCHETVLRLPFARSRLSRANSSRERPPALGMLGFKDIAAPRRDSPAARVLVVFLAGGASQLETWDPKPGPIPAGRSRRFRTRPGRPHLANCCLRPPSRCIVWPSCAASTRTKDDHGKGALHHADRPAARAGRQSIPHLGSAMAKLLASSTNPLPGYIHIAPGGGGSSDRTTPPFWAPA